MDILRKELNSLYLSQRLQDEQLTRQEVERCNSVAQSMVTYTEGCSVITDASCDRCYIYIGALGKLLGISDIFPVSKTVDSSDEDEIYNRMHPEDLVEKRMLEYEFFKRVDSLPGNEKIYYQATCTIRIKNAEGSFTIIDNSTQILSPSPAGKIWLILCCYTLSPNHTWGNDIAATIKNNQTGHIEKLYFKEQRAHILTEREKEVLIMIKEGKLSKQIADLLGISIHTVNRHRQNILEKLSVGNSIEAITAAESMKLL